MCADWSKSAWRTRPRVQMPDYPDAARAGRRRAQARLLSAAGLRRRGAQAEGAAGRGGRGPGLPAAGRRLRRELRRVLRRQHPRHLQGDAADGGGADLRRQGAGGEDRPHGRPVRQAALGRRPRWSAASSCRPTAATSSTASTSPPRRAFPTRRGCCRPTLQSAATLNLLRAFSQGGYADITRVHSWTLDFTAGQPRLRAVPQARQPDLRRARLHAAPPASARRPRTRCTGSTSTPRTRRCCSSTRRRSAASTPPPALPVAGSGHMIWIGDRTRQPDGAHVEFARGVQNPIGLKCGPSITESDLLKLIDRLNPKNEAGRLTLICRFGAGQVGEHLPRLIRAVEREGAQGASGPATRCTATPSSRPSGYKTRPFERVLREVREFFAVHARRGHDPGRRAFRDDRQGRHRMHRRACGR